MLTNYTDEQLIEELKLRQDVRLSEHKKKTKRANRSKAQKAAIARDFKTISSLTVKGFYRSQRGSWSRLNHEISMKHVGKEHVYKIEARQGLVKTYNLRMGFTGTLYLNGKPKEFFLQGKKTTPAKLEKFWNVNKVKLQSMGLV